MRSARQMFFVVLILITIPLLIIYLLSLQLYSIFLLLIPIYLVAIPIIISLVYQAYFHFLIHRKNLSESFQLAFETLKLELPPSQLIDSQWRSPIENRTAFARLFPAKDVEPSVTQSMFGNYWDLSYKIPTQIENLLNQI
jgi:hypothetical protein